MRGNLQFMALGIVGLLLAAALGIVSEPIMEPDTPVIQPLAVHPIATTKEAVKGMMSRECSLTSSLSRPNQPSLNGIVVPSKIPAVLITRGLITTGIITSSAREFGFDWFRRGPPSPLSI